MDLALNNLQRLICHKTKPNQTKLSYHSHAKKRNTKAFSKFKFVFTIPKIVFFSSGEADVYATLGEGVFT